MVNALERLLSKYGYKVREPINLDPPEEKSKLLKDIIEIFLSELNYTAAQVCEVLAISQDELETNYLRIEKRLKLVK